jgi:hypothetical protein
VLPETLLKLIGLFGEVAAHGAGAAKRRDAS